MSNNMAICLSKYDKQSKIRTIGQNVKFINVMDGVNVPDVPPQKISYNDDRTDLVFSINYDTFADGKLSYNREQGYGIISNISNNFLSVFKQEIIFDADGAKEVTRLYPVSINEKEFSFRDYNISNNRSYQYVLYPFDGDGDTKSIAKETQIVKNVKWQGWSLTELHPIDNNPKKFAASPSDVWVFNLNVDTGEQAQNISRQEQQTLGQFNKYSQGKMNYVSGSVTCLLGRDVIPAYKTTNGTYGYQEKLPFSAVASSNSQVEMLLAWRKFVMSSNPKLLKDRAGQSFIVTLTNVSNKPNDAVLRQPNTISFNWVQTAGTEDIEVIGDY